MMLPTKITLESYHRFHLKMWEEQLHWELKLRKESQNRDQIKMIISEIRKHRSLLDEYLEMKKQLTQK